MEKHFSLSFFSFWLGFVNGLIVVILSSKFVWNIRSVFNQLFSELPFSSRLEWAKQYKWERRRDLFILIIFNCVFSNLLAFDSLKCWFSIWKQDSWYCLNYKYFISDLPPTHCFLDDKNAGLPKWVNKDKCRHLAVNRENCTSFTSFFFCSFLEVSCLKCF